MMRSPYSAYGYTRAPRPMSDIPSGIVGPVNPDPASVGGFMGSEPNIRDYDEGAFSGSGGFRGGTRPMPNLNLPPQRLNVPAPTRVRPIGGGGGTRWNPGPSNIGSYFSNGGYYPSGINYTGSGTAYPTTWTRTPGVNGGAVPRALPANVGSINGISLETLRNHPGANWNSIANIAHSAAYAGGNQAGGGGGYMPSAGFYVR